MKKNNNIRNNIFWALDFLKDNKIKKNLEEIHYYNDKKEFNVEQLNKLLEHAVDSVPFYNKLEYTSLSDFPVINKSIIIDNYNRFKSEKYLNKPIHEMATSGSTGTPFTVIQDINKRNRVVADLIYFNEIGNQVLGQKYMHIKTFSKEKSLLTQFKQNEVSVNLLKVTNEQIKEIIDQLLSDKKINSVLAYASTYEQINKYLDNNKYEIPSHINSLFTSSSTLDKEIKIKLSKQLNCKVLDRYSNQENGVIAQTVTTTGEFNINLASFKVELLKLDSDKPVAKNEIGRVVVTDLYNFAMPIIRYDTGDLALSTNSNVMKVKTLDRIEGRQVDSLYNTQGEILTPHIISVNMRGFNKLRQWQVIQTDKSKYLLKINDPKNNYLEEEFIELLKKILGEDADVKVEHVNEIPVLASGKYKNTICEYNNES